MKMDTTQDEITKRMIALNRKCNYSPLFFQYMFETVFNIDHIPAKSDNNTLRISCPICKNEFSIYVRSKDYKKDYSTWKCFSCNATGRYFDSYVGLIRMLYEYVLNQKLSPFQVLYRLEQFGWENGVPTQEVGDGDCVAEEVIPF